MFNSPRWDADLIRRYDKAGPRYTSYPTAVQFHDGVAPMHLLHALDKSRAASRDLSLYVHVPFCANICYYCACNKVITKDRSRAQPYLDSLYREIETVSRHVSREQKVEQLHFGGGTPTFLSHDQLRDLLGKLRQHFSLHDDDTGALQRNFQGYTTHGHCDLVGLGVSSISQIGDLFCQNTADIKQYQQTLDGGQLATRRGLVCHADDHLRRAVITQLICHFNLRFADIEQRFEIDFRDYFGDCFPMLQQMDRDGLIRLSDAGIKVLPAGRLLVRSVCIALDAYQSVDSDQRFSRIT